MTGQRVFRLTCAVQAVVVALGCAVALARQPTHESVAPAVATRPASGGSNQSRARQEAAWLLSLTRVPESARRASRDPRGMDGPVMGTPAVESLVIRTARWRVPMPYAATLAWIQQHPPRDLVRSGSAESGGPGGSEAGYAYSDRPDRSWMSAELDIGVAPDRDGSAIRADAVVVWLDPKPMRDVTSGRRVHVIVAGGCPADDRGVVGVRNDDPILSRRMLPDGHPVGGLVCRYEGLNGKQFGLLKQTRLDESRVASLADAVGRLPLSHVDGGETNCPMDDAATAIVGLSYPGSDDIDLWVTLNGCSFIANGSILAASGPVRDIVLSN